MKSIPIEATASELENRDRFIRQPKQASWLCNGVKRARNAPGITSLPIHEEDRSAVDAAVLHVRQGTIRVLQWVGGRL